MHPTMESEEAQLVLLEEVQSLAKDVEDLRSDMYGLRTQLDNAVMTIREEAKVIQSDTGSLEARAAAAFCVLHRLSHERDETEAQTQITIENLRCALKDMQSKVSAQRTEERTQTQTAETTPSTALVEPGETENACTGALSGAATSKAVDENPTGSQDAATRIIDK